MSTPAPMFVLLSNVSCNMCTWNTLWKCRWQNSTAYCQTQVGTFSTKLFSKQLYVNSNVCSEEFISRPNSISHRTRARVSLPVVFRFAVAGKTGMPLRDLWPPQIFPHGFNPSVGQPDDRFSWELFGYMNH